MTEYETVLYSESDGVATVTLNRPESLNAFNAQMQRELRDIWTGLRRSKSVRSITLTGAGNRAFCAGVDRFEAFNDETPSEQRLNGQRSSPFHFDDLGSWIGPKACDLWLPVIAAVNGIACGGAFYMLGEADIVIAAESATFFDPHLTYGLSAAYESIHMLQKMPFHEVARMALLGASERMSARRAYEIGFVSEVVPDDDLPARAAELAATIASFDTIPVQATVRSLWLGKDMARHDALSIASTMVALGNRPDNQAAGQKDFVERRRSAWRLR